MSFGLDEEDEVSNLKWLVPSHVLSRCAKLGFGVFYYNVNEFPHQKKFQIHINHANCKISPNYTRISS